jgi:branched-subunit amino acid transport protein
MNPAWITVLALAGGTALIKGIGPAVLPGRELPTRAASVIALLPAAVLAALVVDDTIGTASNGLTLDARAAGFAAAIIAVALRLPMLVVIVAAAAATATMRALT